MYQTHLATTPPRPAARRPLVSTKFRAPQGDFLVRRRVLDALEAGPGYRLILLVAPAGSGKSTALAQFAEASSRRVAWYRAERTEADPSALLRHLEYAVGRLVPDLEGGWTDVETAARKLGAVRSAPRCAVVIDDLHELQHSAAETALEQLVGYLPSWLTFHAASRHEPAFNLPRLRVSGLTAEVSADILRWRPWEVERLFRDIYHHRLRPEDAAHLTQRTEGWPAGLQLFYLASKELTTGDHRQLIDDLHTRPGLVRSYLTHNVFSRLPDDLQAFLVDTCVLGRLLPEVCDELRGRHDSLAQLAELTDRRLFTFPCEDGHGYRYHEVLRSYLEVSQLQRDGPRETRSRFALAGKLLEASGWPAEAVHAYVRAEAWTDVDRLLGTDGARLADGLAAPGLHRLPERLIASDPWLQLARARSLWRDGRISAAVEAYRAAERAFGELPAAELCRTERAERQPWIDAQERPTSTPIGLLRAAINAAPGTIVDRTAALDADEPRLVGATAAMLAGDLRLAARLADEVSAGPEASHVTLACSLVLEHLARTDLGAPDQPRLHGCADTLEQLGWTWVSRLVRLVADLVTGDPAREVAAFAATSERHGDCWGPPLARLIGGIAAVLRGGDGTAMLEAAAAGFRAQRASVLQVWADAWAVLSAAQYPRPGTKAAAERMRSLARRLEVPGAEVVADLALAQLARDRSGQRSARMAAHRLGLPLPADRPQSIPPVVSDPLRSRISCFAGLGVTLHGVEIDIGELKPRARLLLARLACPPEELVGREILVEDLWPEASSEGAIAKLQVAISSLRRLLEPDTRRGGHLLQRSDDAYVLRLPLGGSSDVATFDAAVVAGRRARNRQDRRAELDALQKAFDAYRGDLLPEFGNSDWVIDARSRYQVQFAQVAQRLAEHRLAAGDPDGSIAVAEAGLRADRYRTRLWQVLITAYRRLGDPAAAARVARQYEAVRHEIGLPEPVR